MRPIFTEEEFRAAVREADRLDMSALPSEEEIEHTFSPEFLEKMDALIQKSRGVRRRRNLRWLKRSAVGVVVALLFLTSTVTATPSLRQIFLRFTSVVYKEFTHMVFQQTEYTEETAEFTIQKPTYIPEGFLLQTEDLGQALLMIYSDGKDTISYSQFEVQEAALNTNTEGVELEDLPIQGRQAKYYSNQGRQNLIWYDEQYLYRIHTTLGKEILVKIAESVSPAKE